MAAPLAQATHRAQVLLSRDGNISRNTKGSLLHDGNPPPEWVCTQTMVRFNLCVTLARHLRPLRTQYCSHNHMWLQLRTPSLHQYSAITIVRRIGVVVQRAVRSKQSSDHWAQLRCKVVRVREGGSVCCHVRTHPAHKRPLHGGGLGVPPKSCTTVHFHRKLRPTCSKHAVSNSTCGHSIADVSPDAAQGGHDARPHPKPGADTYPHC